MTNSEEKPIFMHQHMQGDQVYVDHQYEDDEVWGKGCDWLSLFCFRCERGKGNDIDEIDTLLHQTGGEHSETWWKCKLRKVKEFSEKLAGPKWKNFIRKMSGYCQKRKTSKNRFQYDPYSYALNFDNGAADREGDDLLQDFSSRFTAPSGNERERTGSGMQ